MKRLVLAALCVALVAGCETSDLTTTAPPTQASVSQPTGGDANIHGCPSSDSGSSAHLLTGEGLTATGLAKAYEIDQLATAGVNGTPLDGSGQTVAVVSFDTFRQSDIDAFDRANGLTGLPPIDREDPFSSAPRTPGAGEEEVDLDLEMIQSIAPGATISDYQACPSIPLGPIIRKIVADKKASIISISYGACESLYRQSAGDRQVMADAESALAAAYAAGISVFVASGDDGAYDCRAEAASDDPQARDFRVDTDFPSTSPSVISVGGTYLWVRTDGTYFDEAGWENPLSQKGGGGGISAVYPMPDWQKVPGIDQQSGAKQMRQVPDVAGPADPSSGLLVYSDCPTPPSACEPEAVGGTSAAAPFWAGSMVLAAQLAAEQNVGPLGALAPVLYQLASQDTTGALLHDVTEGGNLLYHATTGWDYATGWGSPRVGPLVQAIVAYRKANPVPQP